MMHRLTIENLQHIIEHNEGSQDEAELMAYNKAKAELDRRSKLFTSQDEKIKESSLTLVQ